MFNLINITKSSAQIIFTNSTSSVTYIVSKVNKIFKNTINTLVDSVRSTKIFIYTKASNAIQSFSNYFFKKPKADISAVYRKAQDGTKGELRILSNFQKINPLNETESNIALEKISKLSLADTKKLWAVWGSKKKDN